jgi:peptidoglycan/xylan/chitin deacetylase (PgdA/CDA1 family)
VKFIRRMIGKQIKRAFYTTRLHALMKRVHKSQYPVILRYHSISDGNTLICNSITVSLESFDKQAHYFSRNFNIIPMDNLIDCLRKKRQLPQNALILTFDDGYADNYIAAKILHKYRLTGLFYITAGCIESEETFWIAEVRHLLGKTQRHQVSIALPHKTFTAALHTVEDRARAIDELTYVLKTVDVRCREEIRSLLSTQLDDVSACPDDLMLTWGHLKDMVAMGMEIGAHTMTHANLPSAKPDESWFEISESKSTLERRLGIKVSHFAYPNGGSIQHYNDRVKTQVKEAGFLSATTSLPGIAHYNSDLFEIRRIRATENIFDMVWEIEEIQHKFSNKN